MTRSSRSLAFSLALASALAAVSAQQPATHTLQVAPENIVWGNYSAMAKPALTVHSGDTVVMQTLSTCGAPKGLIARGVAAGDIPAYVQPIFDHPPAAENRGPGGHLLTGPVAIEEADAGDVLEVRILKITLDVPWACNNFGAGRGFLPNDFPYSRGKIIPLDRERMIGHFAPNVDVPLHPFFGSMGIAAPGGKTDSAPPWMNAGNMDNKELVAGTTLFIPVNSKGANFEAGDGHAGQGNGEVDITAMETMLTGTFQFVVHKGKGIDAGADPNRLLWPRAETPTQYISMGFHEDLKVATEMAVRNMITFLANPDSLAVQGHAPLSRADAYSLISVACDVDITQLVDLPRVGVHVMCPKALFTDHPPAR